MLSTMEKCNFVVGFVIILYAVVSSQGVIGLINDPCNRESGVPGVCKLLPDCHQLRDDVIKLQKLPQMCGVQGAQPIVCCPTNGKKRQPGVISKLKCKEYSSYASEGSSQSECGHKIVKRIVGGEVASRKEFAHMAIIGYENKRGKILWSCGGSIISEQYIVTAAQCLGGSPGRPQATHVQLGMTELNDIVHKQSFKVAEIIKHPDYAPPSHYNDIGLIKLNKPITLNSYARPACLYTEKEITVETALATGWGITQYENVEHSETLMKVSLNFVDHESCNMSYTGNIGTRRLKYGILKESQVCAGSGGAKRDTCRGDAGGPLQIYHEGDDINCMYDIVGITSFGKDNCNGDSGVYTKISHYVQWIEDTIWPVSS